VPGLPSSGRLTLVAAAILATFSTQAFCQADPLDYVPNLPYTAEVIATDVHTQADGRQVQFITRVFEARDSQGRTRIESFRSGTLYVPLRRQFIQLFPAQKTARVMTFPGTGPIPTHGPSLNAVKTTTETLPGKTIHGIYAEGTQTTQVIPADNGDGADVVDVKETWVSPDLKIVVFSKDTRTDPSSEQTIREILQLDRSEPSAALFEIPADYKIVEASADEKVLDRQ
jgi:hypothetical protein